MIFILEQLIQDLHQTLNEFVSDPEKYNSVSEDVQDTLNDIKIQITRLGTLSQLASSGSDRRGQEEEESGVVAGIHLIKENQKFYLPFRLYSKMAKSKKISRKYQEEI